MHDWFVQLCGLVLTIDLHIHDNNVLLEDTMQFSNSGILSEIIVESHNN